MVNDSTESGRDSRVSGREKEFTHQRYAARGNMLRRFLAGADGLPDDRREGTLPGRMSSSR